MCENEEIFLINKVFTKRKFFYEKICASKKIFPSRELVQKQ